MERRQHRRVVQPFEGSWSGSSGGTECRIGDISLGGCFVQSVSTPGKDESTVVTVVVGGHKFAFTGRVVNIEPGLGFSVQFRDLPPEDAAELARLIDALDPGPASR